MKIKCPGCDVWITSQGESCLRCETDLRPLLLMAETADVYFNRGLEACRRGDFLTALEELAVARALSPADSQAWKLAGKASLELGQKQRAVSYFSHALEIDAGDKEALGALMWLVDQGCEVVL